MDDIKIPWGKAIAWFFGIVIAIGIFGMVLNVIGLGFGIAWLPFYKVGAKLNATQGIIDITYDAQRCIDTDAQYQTFKTQVPALRDEQIPNAQKALDSFEAKLPKDQTKWSITQQQFDSELQTNVTGLQQQLSSLQAQYDAFVARPDIQPCAGKFPTFIDIR